MLLAITTTTTTAVGGRRWLSSGRTTSRRAGAGAARLAAVSVSPPPALEVLYDDKHLVVVNKPPGVLSQGAHGDSSASEDGGGATDMLAQVKAHLAAGRRVRGPAYVGLVHRLDRNVSGAMVFAKRSKAAARLGEAFREQAVKKVYVAVVLGEVEGRGPRTLRHALVFSPSASKDRRRSRKNGNVTRVVGDDALAPAPSPPSGDGGKTSPLPPPPAVIGTLRYEPLLVFPHPHRPGDRETLLRVELLSGRKHQIRAQLSHIGHPIVGDVKYGAPVALRDRSIALHCRLLAFPHPRRGGEGEGGGAGGSSPATPPPPPPPPAAGPEEGKREGEGEGMVVACRAPLPPSWLARFGPAVVAAVERVGVDR